MRRVACGHEHRCARFCEPWGGAAGSVSSEDPASPGGSGGPESTAYRGSLVTPSRIIADGAVVLADRRIA